MSEHGGSNSSSKNHEEASSTGDDDCSMSITSESTTLTNGPSRSSRSNTPTLGGGSAKPPGKKAKRKRLSHTKQKSNSGNTTSTNSPYKYACMAKEDHGKPIFGVQFNNCLKEGETPVFATAGSNRVSVYECMADGNIKLVQVYMDPDPEEMFYCCAWSYDGEGNSLLAAAGARGIIRIFEPLTASCKKHYLGHGNAINDLIFHPHDENLLLSASKDHALRLWNIKSDHCIAIFGGVEGHRDEVLAADFKFDGTRIVSCGMDHALKIWKLDTPGMEQAIELSYNFNSRSNRPFPTLKENFPEFSTRDIHRNYVDCTKFFGEYIFSKSCENNIICWKPGKTFQTWDDINMNTNTETTVICRLDIAECEIWFMRFAMDLEQNMLALGNQRGKIYVYDLDVQEPRDIKQSILANPKCTTAVRQTAFSRNGEVLVCVCDDGTIWKWDKILKTD